MIVKVYAFKKIQTGADLIRNAAKEKKISSNLEEKKAVTSH